MHLRKNRPEVDFKKKRKSLVVPGQSLTIKDIMEKHMRGIPAVGKVYNGVFGEGTEDLEKLARLDFDEKHALAQMYKAQAEAAEAKLEEIERARKEAREERERELKEADEPERKRRADARPDIDSLDNTMSDDTALTNKQLREKKGRV